MPIRESWPSASDSCGDVRVHHLAHLGHRVDERDLGGQERVGRDLDQLGGGEVGHHDRACRRRSPARTRPAATARPAPSATPKTSRSGCRVSSTAKPSRRNSGFQATSTSVGRGRARRPARPSAAAVPAGTVDLPTTSARPGQQRRQRAERRLDVASGPPRSCPCAAACPRRRSARRRTRPTSCVRRGEPQPAGVQRLAQQLGQPGLEERHLAGAELRDLGLVDVQADDLEASSAMQTAWVAPR